MLVPTTYSPPKDAASHTEENRFSYDAWRVTSISIDEDQTSEILADTEFADALRESIKQADSGNTTPWEEVKAELGL